MRAFVGRSEQPRYWVEQGVAIVPIAGSLINRGDYLGEGYGVTSYVAIAREVSGKRAKYLRR